MPIRRYLDNPAAFDPAAIGAMSQALEEACTALSVPPDDAARRQIIAARVIDFARQGVPDAKILAARVIEAMRSL
jgi:hypothetical protein